jgi:nicotinamidase-related amidase
VIIERESSALVVIDVQERLAPAILERERLLARIKLLIDAAVAMSIPTVFTEQNPAGLGHTVALLREAAPTASAIGKVHFQATLEPGLGDWMRQARCSQAVVVGTEAHVCVLQTTLGLLGLGLACFLVADAVGSRREEDRRLAIERLRAAGCSIVSAEMVLFEWLKRSGTEAFRGLLPRIKDEG